MRKEAFKDLLKILPRLAATGLLSISLTGCGADKSSNQTQVPEQKGGEKTFSCQIAQISGSGREVLICERDDGKIEIFYPSYQEAEPRPTLTQEPTPTLTQEPKPTPTQEPTPKQVSTPDKSDSSKNIFSERQEIRKRVIENLEKAGIIVEIDHLHPNWPVTHEEALEAIKPDGKGKNNLTAENLIRVIEVVKDGEFEKRIWRGWWIGESFPLSDKVRYNEELNYHEIIEPDEDGKRQLAYEINKVFDTDKGPRLTDVRLNLDFAALFARRGGKTVDGLPSHSHYFTGEKGTGVESIEQITIIPVPEKTPCVDFEPNIIAWRQAVKEFIDNPHVRDGWKQDGVQQYINVYWFDPSVSEWKKLMGRTIAELAKFAKDKSLDLDIIDRLKQNITYEELVRLIDSLPPGYPLSPHEMAQKYGGEPYQWVISPKTLGGQLALEWFFEAWPLKKGIFFDESNGIHFTFIDGKKVILFGPDKVNAQSGNSIFDFSLPPQNMAPRMYAPLDIPAVLFVRVGTMSKDYENNSWYTWGHGHVVLGQPVIEQATLFSVFLDACVDKNAPKYIAEERAKEQPDLRVKARYWDGEKFVEVIKNQR
ncbi:MAG: hypothetical protein NZL96_02280 [Patescibacteria group bacterium]|nr:hypothetical protein [Patescibacteria group bacterium]